ncbi:hypothetical protein PS687_02501 [Pseudomonas fluorescens]|nr:hypothetical protein PS687_02501 [Pseudomonas fluorescens]
MKQHYVKRCGFLTKRNDMTKEQFINHWQQVHAVLCQKVPGLKRYAVNYIDRDVFPSFPFDGFSELWFESRESYEAMLSSPEGKTLMADLPNFTDTVNGVLITEQRYVWPEDDGL